MRARELDMVIRAWQGLQRTLAEDKRFLVSITTTAQKSMVRIAYKTSKNIDWEKQISFSSDDDFARCDKVFENVCATIINLRRNG